MEAIQTGRARPCKCCGLTECVDRERCLEEIAWNKFLREQVECSLDKWCANINRMLRHEEAGPTLYEGPVAPVHCARSKEPEAGSGLGSQRCGGGRRVIRKSRSSS